MRTNIFRLLLVALVAFGLMGCQEEKATSQNAAPAVNTPIAVIDQTQIFEKSTTIAGAKEHINTIFEKLDADMNALKGQAEKVKNKEKAKKMLEEGVLEAQQKLEAEDRMVTGKISALIEEAVKETKKEVGATIVISTDLLIAYDNKADITDMIIAKIDKKPLSFTDEAQEEAKEEAGTDVKAEGQPADAQADAKADADKKADTKEDAQAPAAADKK